MASRTFAHWISKLKQTGYEFHLIYLWIPSAEMAVARVAQRVQQKGHHVPDDVVRRRYLRGLANFFQLYRPLATSWGIYYNAVDTGPKLIAEGGENLRDRILDHGFWEQVKGEVANEAE